jgi:excisionase family DNA binding protein
MSQKLFFTVNEAAEILGLSRITVYRGTQSGKILSRKVGGRPLIPASWISALASSQPEPALEQVRG